MYVFYCRDEITPTKTLPCDINFNFLAPSFLLFFKKQKQTENKTKQNKALLDIQSCVSTIANF